jgi:hypothetical protein
VIFALLDPDPESGYGSTDLIESELQSRSGSETPAVRSKSFFFSFFLLTGVVQERERLRQVGGQQLGGTRL